MKWYKIKTLPEDTLCSHSHSLGSDLRYVITPSNNNSNLRHWASLVSQLVKNPPATQETPDRFLDREDPLKKGQVSRSRTPGFPGGSAVKNLPAMQEIRVPSLVREDPLENKMASTPVFLHTNSHEQRNLAGYDPWAHKRVRQNLATKPSTTIENQMKTII